MAKIYVTRTIPNSGIALLRDSGHEVVVSKKEGVLSKEELLTELQKEPYDAVLCLLTDKIDRQIYDAAPQVKIFANYAVGFDNIDVEEAKKRGIVISNTPEVLSNTVAEHTFALLLAIAHRIVEADLFVREGKYEGWAPLLLLGNDLSGKTLGIVGAGRIGARVAHHGKRGFDMKVLYYDIKKNEHLEEEVGAEFCEYIEDLLEQVDFVSLHIPLLDSTKHLLNKERLARMKKTAYLVNTSRGGVIDEKALFEALERKNIRGAALDVFEHEPDLTAGLSSLSNVIVTPHIASATEETRSKMSKLAAENILAVLSGSNAPNAVS
ncbi:MAG: D-glycerate dehydrogenase [Candidatus Paceibacterota bacterium]